ncbi:MAG: alpha/beta fold hydrolase [Anaerolineae bacterium]|nr:alpha/beta fold hydrolase [Anaerolineae bacterium]
MYSLELVSHTPEVVTRHLPILFIHGAWHAAWCWEEHFAPYFASRGFATYSLSLRGHGHSRGKQKLRWFSIDDYLEDVRDIIDELPQKPVLIGHSMGGYLTQRYLETETAPAAVLLAPAPSNGAWLLTAFGLRYVPLGVLQAALTLSTYPMIGTPERARRAFFSPELPEEQLRHTFVKLRSESFRAYLELLFVKRLKTEAVRERGTPTLIVGGERDRLFPPPTMEKLSQSLGADLRIIPQTAHDIMLEARWQDAADAIIDWLTAKGL